MPWNLDYTMDGWAHDNTAADWKQISNHDYVITLDKMPGWGNYNVSTKIGEKQVIRRVAVRYSSGILNVSLFDENATSIEICNLQGSRISTLSKGFLKRGSYHFVLNNIANGLYFVYVKYANSSRIAVEPIVIK
jgi:hypothetical protein